MADSNKYVFDKQGGFNPSNLCDGGNYGIEDAIKSAQSGNKRGYIGVRLTNRDYDLFAEDVANAIGSSRMYIGFDNLGDYMRTTMGDVAWDDLDHDYNLPLPRLDSLELRLGRKGDDLAIMDTVLCFADAEYYPDGLSCKNCLDLYRFSEEERKGLVDVALKELADNHGISKDDIMDSLVDWDVDKETTDDYYDGCLFDRQGNFCTKNMIGVGQLNDKSVELFGASEPASCDHFTVFFRGCQSFRSLKDDLNNGARAGKTCIGDMDEYIGDIMASEPPEYDPAYGAEMGGDPMASRDIEHGLYDRPYPEPDYICVDIGLNNGEFEIRGSRLCFCDDEAYGVDFTSEDYLRLNNLSEAEKADVIDFALYTAGSRGGLSSDDIERRLIDREAIDYNALTNKAIDSAYDRLMNEMIKQHYEDLEYGDEYDDNYDNCDNYDDEF